MGESVTRCHCLTALQPTSYFYRECEDVFAEEILEPYCKFCYAKKFKMSAINIQDILEIAPESAYCI